MLPKLTAAQLLAILEDTEYTARRYSGGGMRGAECVAFTVDDGKDLFAVAQIVSRTDETLVPLLVRAFQFAKVDGIGRSGVVVYFPGIEWPTGVKEPAYEFDDRDRDAEDWDSEDWDSEDD